MIETRKAYLYLKGNHIKEIISVLEIYEDYKVVQIQENFLEITVTTDFDIQQMIKVRDLVMVELFQDFTVFVVPKNFDFKINDILEILPKLNKGIYQIENFIYEIVKLGDRDLVQKIKGYYYNRLSPETIETVLGFIDQDLNATKTAKALFMHRNTLNYRLDNFIKKTEIDVRKFSGALAIYLLFKY